MLVGRLPFSSKCNETNDQGNKVLFEKILNDEVRFPLDLSTDSKSILWQLLEKKPSKRLGASVHDFNEIKAHSFFSTIEWSKLIDKRLEPPFRPQVSSDSDTCYFEKEFTGENVQLTPPGEESPLSNNYFDSFSYYGSKTSLNSHKSNSSHSLKDSSFEESKSDKYDTSSLAANHTHLTSIETNNLIRSKFSYLAENVIDNEDTITKVNSNETWKFLASSAFPNIMPSSHVRLEEHLNVVSSKTGCFINSASSSSSISDSDFKNLNNLDEKMDVLQ